MRSYYIVVLHWLFKLENNFYHSEFLPASRYHGTEFCLFVCQHYLDYAFQFEIVSLFTICSYITATTVSNNAIYSNAQLLY